MPLLIIGSFLFGVLLTWLFLKSKFKKSLSQALTEATVDLTTQVEGMEGKLKESSQKIADLEYTVREKEKDLAALKSSKNN